MATVAFKTSQIYLWFLIVHIYRWAILTLEITGINTQMFMYSLKFIINGSSVLYHVCQVI